MGWLRPVLRSGLWESTDSATFATCYKGLYPWNRQSTYCFVDTKLLFKSEVVWYKSDLPGAWPNRTHADGAGFDAVILKDCNHAVLYVLVVSPGEPRHYEVYNRDGKLVARTARGEGGKGLEQIRFIDEQGKPIADAERPVFHVADQPSDGDTQENSIVAPWDIRFYDAFTSRSSLLIAQNRWVLAAAVQDLVFNDKLQRPSPWDRLFGLFLLFAVLPIVLFCGSLSVAFGLAFPPAEKPEGRFAEAGHSKADGT
mmetsp:Transcript_20960/g.63688  ORF Transcript_20960/g.63688 Transcript_20960/m.63688 type:complete len:255 (+) Transcript_20960:3-767(+)